MAPDPVRAALPTALIGHSGFVGSNLLRQRPFDACFRSHDIGTIAGREFGLLVCAGVPAEKWKANADPAADRAAIARLTDALRDVRTERAVLISTVDVYGAPQGVDESTAIDPERSQPYGRHRFELEQHFAARWPTLVVRLPALYGTGLKKNVVYDLLHGNQVERIHADARFQYYGLDRLWPDIARALDAGLELVNCATEPVSVQEVARAAFGMEFDNRPGAPPAGYDVRSRHAALFGGRDGYLQSTDEVLAGLARFVRAQRTAGP